jgi:hypothetical protein
MLLRSLLVFAFGACCLVSFAHEKAIRTLLINRWNLSPILQVSLPRANSSCAAKELRLTLAPGTPVRAQACEYGRCTPMDPSLLTYFDRFSRINATDIRLGAGEPSAGPVTPVDGPGDLKWLCRNDEEGKQCICIPWFPPE